MGHCGLSVAVEDCRGSLYEFEVGHFFVRGLRTL
jgi:hypothetical protein